MQSVLNMYRDNIFRICLILSISLHAGIMIPWSFLNFFAAKDAGCQNIELTYFSGAKAMEARVNKLQDAYAKKLSPEPVKSNTPDVEPKPNAEVRTPAENKLNKEKEEGSAVAEKAAAQEHEIEIPDIGAQKGAVYEKYYLDVRGKIRSIIEKNKRAQLKESEIYVRFVVDRQGALRDLRLYKASGAGAGNLEALAIRSIKEAAPFPPFGDKIKEDELQFNLPIRVIRKY